MVLRSLEDRLALQGVCLTSRELRHRCADGGFRGRFADGLRLHRADELFDENDVDIAEVFGAWWSACVVVKGKRTSSPTTADLERSFEVWAAEVELPPFVIGQLVPRAVAYAATRGFAPGLRATRIRQVDGVPTSVRGRFIDRIRLAPTPA